MKEYDMTTETLHKSFLPELGVPIRGKVRDIYDLGDELLLVASDRLSVFNRILPDQIRDKGHLLTKLSHFWFEQTRDIVCNHIVSYPAPNALIVTKCTPYLVEVVVRAYLVGSMWRDYQAGKRDKCGNILPDGLTEGSELPTPIITPTTKDEDDDDITKEEIVRRGLVPPDVWADMEATAMKLFQRGQDIAKKRGLILVDTKYEFGKGPHGELVLIDEVHTPDSSRYFIQKEYAREQIRFPDKEFARKYIREELGFTGEGPAPTLSPEFQEQVREGYREIYSLITGNGLDDGMTAESETLVQGLKDRGVIKGVFALVLAGARYDGASINTIVNGLEKECIPCKLEKGLASDDVQVLDLIDQYNDSLEPVVIIVVGDAQSTLADSARTNSRWPVIAFQTSNNAEDIARKAARILKNAEVSS